MVQSGKWIGTANTDRNISWADSWTIIMSSSSASLISANESIIKRSKAWIIVWMNVQSANYVIFTVNKMLDSSRQYNQSECLLVYDVSAIDASFKRTDCNGNCTFVNVIWMKEEEFKKKWMTMNEYVAHDQTM